MVLCACGCGKEATGCWKYPKRTNKGKYIPAKYIHGHWTRTLEAKEILHNSKAMARFASNNKTPKRRESQRNRMLALGENHPFKRPEVKIKRQVALHTPEVIVKRSGENHYMKKLENRLKYRAENAGNWKGGIAKLPYSFNFNSRFKKQIRERDNFFCQLCGISEEDFKASHKKNLSVNHIDYDKMNTTEFNCITLCLNCNSRVNADREFWTSYFSQMLNERYVIGQYKNIAPSKERYLSSSP